MANTMVIKYLTQLLQEKDEVIVNDLGTFTAIYGSTEIHSATHTFSPPCKNITFNSKLKLSNQVLEQYIAKNEGISPEKASEEVRNFVASLKTDLGIQKKYMIEDLGEFSLQLSDQPDFKQNKDFNFLSESFGLPEILTKPIERSEGEQNQAQQRQNALINKKNNASNSIPTPNKPLEGTEGKKTPWGTFAAIGSLTLVSFAVVYVLFIDNSLNPFKHLLAGNNDTTKTQTKDNKDKNDTSKINVVVKKDRDTTSTASKDTEKPVVEDNKKVETIKDDPKENTNTTNTTSDEMILNNPTSKYYIVLGGFGNVGNAQKKLQEVQSSGKSNVKIIAPYGGKNIYRVVLGSFGTQADAETQVSSLRSDFGQDIWVLKY
jgi:cell division protein FtsN